MTGWLGGEQRKPSDDPPRARQEGVWLDDSAALRRKDVNKRQATQVAYELISGIIQGALDMGGGVVEDYSEADIRRIQAAMEKVAEEMRHRGIRLEE